MNSLKLTLLAFGAMALGCVTSDDATTSNADSGTGTSDSMTASDTNTMSASNTMTDTMTTTVDTSGTEESSTTVDPSIFEFNQTPPEDYVQLDRKGFPGVNTALNIFGDKNAYNQAAPVDDGVLTFAGEAVASLRFLHWGDADAVAPPAMPGPGLNDDLAALGLDPCTAPPMAGFGECLDISENNGGQFAIPDTVKIDTNAPAGFPNGRLLTDPVIDVILAVLLLDLDFNQAMSPVIVDGTNVLFTFTAIQVEDGPVFSLNPPANDVEFPGDWPHLAPPQ